MPRRCDALPPVDLPQLSAHDHAAPLDLYQVTVTCLGAARELLPGTTASASRVLLPGNTALRMEHPSTMALETDHARTRSSTRLVRPPALACSAGAHESKFRPLCLGYHFEFQSDFRYCRSLRSEDSPDYECLKRLFRVLFIQDGWFSIYKLKDSS